MLIDIKPDGNNMSICSDALQLLLSEGEPTVRRASHVEMPHGNCRWIADLSPVGEPMLGPFRLRKEALAAEAEWLEANEL